MKKKLMTVLAIVLVIALSVAGTYAYLTSQAEVKNTFTVGNVAITMDETDVDANGVAIADAARVQENTYKLMPGHEYTKDPTIHVDADSEDCYLFVKVENGLAGIEAADNTIAAQMATNGWTPIAEGSNVYAYATTVAAGADCVVFENFTIANAVDNDTLAGYASANITVTAYAVQADGFATAAEAWAAASLA